MQRYDVLMKNERYRGTEVTCKAEVNILRKLPWFSDMNRNAGKQNKTDLLYLDEKYYFLITETSNVKKSIKKTGK